MHSFDLSSVKFEIDQDVVDPEKVKQAIVDYNDNISKSDQLKRKKSIIAAATRKKNKGDKAKSKQTNLSDSWDFNEEEPTDEFAIESLTEFISHWNHYQRIIPKIRKNHALLYELGLLANFLKEYKVFAINLRGTKHHSVTISVPNAIIGEVLESIKGHRLLRDQFVEQSNSISSKLRQKYSARKPNFPKSLPTGSPELANAAFWHGNGPRIVKYLRLAGFSKEFIAYIVGKELQTLNKALDLKRWKKIKNRELIDHWLGPTLPW